MSLQQKLISETHIKDRDALSSLYFDEDTINTLSYSSLLAKSGVPDTHRRAADNYMIIKKVFGHPVVKGKISLEEKKFLAKFDFNLLEYSTIKQINEEIKLLQKWSLARDYEQQDNADYILQIRSKELKYLIASKYIAISNEIYNGYKAMDRYFEDISKYARY